jgi:hypothetical protein
VIFPEVPPQRTHFTEIADYKLLVATAGAAENLKEKSRYVFVMILTTHT